MTPEDWIAAGKIIDEMRRLGFFMACWSPGGVTNGRTYFYYPQWRVHFQRGAEEVAPTIDAEGYGWGETFLEAVRKARDEVMRNLSEWEQSYRESNDREPPVTGR
jgi:hypothetical protein